MATEKELKLLLKAQGGAQAAAEVRAVEAATADLTAATGGQTEGEKALTEARERARARLEEYKAKIRETTVTTEKMTEGTERSAISFDDLMEGLHGAAAILPLVTAAFTAGWKAIELLTDKLTEADRARAMLPELAKQTRDTVTPAEQAAAAYEKVALHLKGVVDQRKADVDAIRQQVAAIDALEAALLAEKEAEIDLAVARGEMTEGEGAVAKRGEKRAAEDAALERQRLQLQTAVAAAQRAEQEALAAYQSQASAGGPMGAARDALNQAIRGVSPELRDAKSARADANRDLGLAMDAGDEEKAAAAKQAVEQANEEYQAQQRELIARRRKEFEDRKREFEATEKAALDARRVREREQERLRDFDGVGAETRGAIRRAEDKSFQARQEREANRNQTAVPDEVMNSARAVLTMADQTDQPMVALMSQLISALQNGTDAPELREWSAKVQAMLEKGIHLSAGDRARMQQLSARLDAMESRESANRSL